MRKTVYRLKKFRLSEISLVDRPACDIARVERIELVKRSMQPRNEAAAGPKFVKVEEIDNMSADTESRAEVPGSKQAGREGQSDRAVMTGTVAPGAEPAPGPDAAYSREAAPCAEAAGSALELKKYVPLTSLPLADNDDQMTQATSLAQAMSECAIDPAIAELCDLFMLVVSNVLNTEEIADKPAAILTVADELRAALEALLSDGRATKLMPAGRLRKMLAAIGHASREAECKRAIAEGLRKRDFQWPRGAAAVRVLGQGDRSLGVLAQAEFENPEQIVPAVRRGTLDELYEALLGSGSAMAGTIPGAASSGAPANGRNEALPELAKMLTSLRQTADALSVTADEVRKVAEASAGSIRKAEGSARVLSVLAERVARLEAQPDTSRAQPLRTVEKGTPLGLLPGDIDDSRAQITELQREAAELRKRAGDGAAMKRLSEIGVEIIRLSNGVDPAAAVFRAATVR